MSFFNRLLGQNPSIQCPRCLGKGHVDWDDIKRLKQELRWRPGKCAYCKGKGKVSPGLINKVAVDTSYLTSDLPIVEQQRVLGNESGAMKRASLFDTKINTVIDQILYLHFICKLDADKIADFYLLANIRELYANGTYESEKEELIDYVNRVIASKNKNELN